MLKRKGQSVLEYVIILTAILAAIIFGAQQFLKPKVENSLDHVTTQMETQVNKITF